MKILEYTPDKIKIWEAPDEFAEIQKVYSQFASLDMDGWRKALKNFNINIDLIDVKPNESRIRGKRADCIIYDDYICFDEELNNECLERWIHE